MSDRINRTIMELRWPLIVLALALVLGSAIITASWYVEQSKNREYQQVQNRLRGALLALNNIRQDGADLEAYRDQFDSLMARGIYGDEQRLNWVEYMTSLGSKGRLQSLNYEITPQRPVSVTLAPQATSIEILASRIQLKMGFLHEEDLARAFEDLHSPRSGLYRLEGCTLKRKEGNLTPVIGENLTADCRLQWITMRSR